MPNITKAPVLFCFPGFSLEVICVVAVPRHFEREKMDSALLSKGPLCLAGLRKLVKNGCAKF